MPFILRRFIRRSSFVLQDNTAEGRNRLLHTDAASFPQGWREVRTFPWEAMADCSPFFFKGVWYILGAYFTGSPWYARTSLRLFRSVGPHAHSIGRCEWAEHPSSPVSRNPNNARPGGRIVVHEGRVYRFAQDLTPTYSDQVRVFELFLTPQSYREIETAGSPASHISGLTGFPRFRNDGTEGYEFSHHERHGALAGGTVRFAHDAARTHHVDAHYVGGSPGWVAAIDSVGYEWVPKGLSCPTTPE